MSHNFLDIEIILAYSLFLSTNTLKISSSWITQAFIEVPLEIIDPFKLRTFFDRFATVELITSSAHSDSFFDVFGVYL